MILKAGRHQLLCGIEWIYASNEERAKEIAKEQRKAEKKPSVVLPNGSDGSWIVGVYPKEPPTRGKIYAAAPLFAKAIGEGIFVANLDDHNTWIFAAGDGAVIPGFDLVVPKNGKLQHLQEIVQKTGIDVFYGDVQGSQEKAEAIIERVVEIIENDDFAKSVILYKHQKYYKYFLYLFGFCVLSYATYTHLFPVLKNIYDAKKTQAASINNDAFKKIQMKMEKEKAEKKFMELASQKRDELKKLAIAQDYYAVVSNLKNQNIPFSFLKIEKIDCEKKEKKWSCTPEYIFPINAGPIVESVVSSNDESNLSRSNYSSGSFFTKKKISGKPFTFESPDGVVGNVSFSDHTIWAIAIRDTITSILPPGSSASWQEVIPVVVTPNDFGINILDKDKKETVGYVQYVKIDAPYSSSDLIIEKIRDIPGEIQNISFGKGKTTITIAFYFGADNGS